MSLRILAFEPFDAGSHKAVRESISRHARDEWTWVTRPGRAWKWRMRLAAIEMIDAAAGRGLLDRPYDAIVATSLMSATDLRAMLPASMRVVPLILYMHENQAAYPVRHATETDAERDVHFALTNLAGVLAADLVIWNSTWNRQSFLDGMDRILAHAPDGAPRDARPRIESRSTVLWPPVEPPPTDHARAAPLPDGALHNAIRVVWPHRWEHDKGAEELLDLATRHSDELDLRWTILGEQFREVPRALAEFQRRLVHRIDHFGFEPDRVRYWQHLARCDWVLSTSQHDFFGVAVVEALLAGCLPWLPDRLSYPEILPATAHGLSPMRPPADDVAARRAIRAHLAPCAAATAVGSIERAIKSVVGSD